MHRRLDDDVTTGPTVGSSDGRSLPHPAWSSLMSLAAAQGGSVHVRQAEALGIPRRTLHHWAARLTWERPHPGVYRLLPTVGVAGAHWPAYLHASACRTEGADRPLPTAVTGATAWDLWGLPTPNQPQRLQLAVPYDRRRPAVPTEIDVVRTHLLTPDDIEVIDGQHVVRPAWALLHLGRVAPDWLVLDLAVRSRQRGRLGLADMASVLARCRRAPGRRAFRLAYEALTEHTVDSSFELSLRRLLRGVRPQPWPAPFPFQTPDGHVIHLDVAWPTAWFALEGDALSTHEGAGSFELDRTRWGQAQAGGWRVAWATPHRLRTDPRGIVAEVAGALEVGESRPPARPTRCHRRGCQPCAHPMVERYARP